VLFPRVKVWVVFFFVRFKLGVLWYFGNWLFFNSLNAILDAPGIAWFGHIGGFAAERLGLKRTTLQSRMKKLGIRRPPA
jgi:membrane associated rhomboid family serine protease